MVTTGNNKADDIANDFNPFEGPEIVKLIPAIEPQLEIWTSCQIGGNEANRAFNESLSVKFEGPFNKSAFDLALNALVERHESMRSAFTEDGSKMIVFKTIHLNYEYKDISLKSEDEQSAELAAIKLNDAFISFDLIQGPLFKFSLLKISEENYFFTLTAHHIICDGWSIGLLIQDLSKLYSAYAQNIEPNLPQAASFSDYAIEQINFSKSSEYKKNENFWLGQFSKNIPVLNIPTDFERPNPRTYKSSRIDFSIDTELINSLKIVGVKEGCSLVNTLLASFELFLHAYTGQDDIIIGLPTAGQLVSGYYELVGHCVSLLPIRSYPNSQLSFYEYLKARKSSILDAYEHQRLTFGSLIQKLNLPRQASRIPLVPVVFNMDMEMESETHFHQLKFDIYSNPREFENFELYLNVWNTKNGIQLEWSYNTQLFKKATIEKMMQDFESLLHSIVQKPHQKLEQLLQKHGKIGGHSTSNILGPIDTQLEQSRNYYLNLFSGELPTLDFPYDNVQNANDRYTPGNAIKNIENKTFEALLLFQNNQQISFSSILLSAIEVFLYKYTSSCDLIIGYQSMEANTIAIRSYLSKEYGFSDLINQTNFHLSDGLYHQAYTLKNLLLDLGLDENSPSNGLFTVTVSLLDLQNSNFSDNFTEKKLAFQNLHFQFVIEKDRLNIELNYNQTLINPQTAVRLLDHFSALLKALMDKPQIPLEQIKYLSDLEEKTIIETFNQTDCVYPNNETVAGLFEKQVDLTPDKIALEFESKKFNYKELNNISNQLAIYLRNNYNIQAEDLIGIQLERSEWLIISILAILKSGGAYVPIDPEYPKERIDYLITNSGCKLVIDLAFLSEFLKFSDHYSPLNLPNVNSSNDLVYVIYTSGSTGQPKGVMVEQRNVIRLVKSVNYVSLEGKERLLSTGAISFDATTFEYWSMLLNGGTLVLCSQNTLLDFKLLASEIQRLNIDIMWFTSGWLNQLVDADISLFKNLKTILAGGDKLSNKHINKLLQTYPELQIINGYGPTENTTFSLTFLIDKQLENIPLGKPISNCKVYIFDCNNQLAPVGVNGEIVLGGDGISRGYLGQPTLTNTKFIDSPFEAGKKLYRSGDIGRWLPDGNILFFGRQDFQVKIRGYRIELGEIESYLVQYPGIVDATVLVINDRLNEKHIVAYYVKETGIEQAELKNYLRTKLPNYMVPTFFIEVSELPLTKNGKVDRNNLPNPFNKTAIALDSNLLNETENKLIVIWSDLLGLSNITKHDNFFEIGGHSLIAIRLILRLESEIGVKLPMSSLFEYPTIEKLAKLINSETKIDKFKCLVPIQPVGDKTPLYLIHGGGLGVLIFSNIVKYLDKNQPVYGLQALGIDGQEEPLDTIEEMAKFYISEILSQNPKGPYAIAGLSAGGLIAYEMAQQFKKMGKVLDLVAIFDFDLYEIEKFNNKKFSHKLKRMFKNVFPRILFFFKSLFKFPQKTYAYYLMCWKLRFVTLKQRLGFKQNETIDSVHSDLNKAMAKNETAYKNYLLRPYTDHLDLFIAKNKVYYQKDAKYMGWRKFAVGGITLHEVEGDHDDMILPPNNKNFAFILQNLIDSRSTK